MKIPTIEVTKAIVLLVFSALAIYTDYKWGKIYNWMNFSMILIGIFISIYGRNTLSSILGIILGFVFMFPFFVSGGMGAGDVKFAMATGALVGGKLLLLAFGVAGVLILLYAIARRLGVIKLLSKGLKDIGRLIKSTGKFIFSTIKISAVSGRLFVPDKTDAINKSGYKVRYGVFLGFSNILLSFYIIIEKGGIK